MLESENVPAHLEHRGRILKEGFARVTESLGLDFVRCVGMGCRSMVTFEARDLAAGVDPLLMKSLVQQELLRRGVLWSGFHNLALAHGDAEIDCLLVAYQEALAVLREALDAKNVQGALRGEPMEPVFRRTDGFHLKPRPRLLDGRFSRREA